MQMKILGHYCQLQLVLLGLTEFAATTCTYAFIAAGRSAMPGASLAIRSLLYGGFVIVAMIAMGLFSRRQRDRIAGIFLRIVMCVAAASCADLLATALFGAPGVSLIRLGWISLTTCLLITTARGAAFSWINTEVFKRQVLVIGAGQSASRIAKLRRVTDLRGFKVTGYVQINSEAIGVDERMLVRITGPLLNYAVSHDINEVVVAAEDKRQGFSLHELLACRLAGIEVTELVQFIERETGKICVDILVPSWIIYSSGSRQDSLRRVNQRIFDIISSSALLLIASPLLLLVALAIKLEDGLRAPVLYRQERVGFGGKNFQIVKFRSMGADAEGDGQAKWASSNDARVTRVGRIIRKPRLDELPQLLNVLRGEMSFVGPRPERPEFVAQLCRAIPYYEYRHTVKPGITGWAQLCYPYGASEADAMEKLQYDLYYIKNHGLLFDLLILLSTVEVIVFSKGAR
jgi:sugar transferase (PEP-CTERM system associated)